MELILFSGTLMLTARAYKLWGDNKVVSISPSTRAFRFIQRLTDLCLYEQILAFMLLFSIVQLVGQLAVALVQTVPVPVGNGVKACVPTTKSTVYVIYWLLPVVNHVFISVITFIKAWELAAISTGSSGAKSLTLLPRCHQVIFSRFGLVFPITIVIVEIAQVIFYLVADDMQRAVSDFPEHSL